MTESKVARSNSIVALARVVAATCLLGCTQTTGGVSVDEVSEETGSILPWEWWRDLATIASVPSGDRVVMQSSHCPSGCQYDRHSEGDSRFIRTRPNGEGVIFEADGPGAVTRIWMVMGDGITEPLDGSVRLRVRIDGRRSPVVDLPLPALFDGSKAPFFPPLVADIDTSGGGNVSHVPITFRDGCEITLVNADRTKIWFQIGAHLVDSPGEEYVLLETEGSGKWVGLVTDVRRFDGQGWNFLEADEIVAINGEDLPSWKGTGVEDFFNGGFYSRNQEGDPTQFVSALAGAPMLPLRPVAAVMYRLLLGDAPVFEDGLRAGLEVDQAEDAVIRTRTVAYLYTLPQVEAMDDREDVR